MSENKHLSVMWTDDAGLMLEYQGIMIAMVPKIVREKWPTLIFDIANAFNHSDITALRAEVLRLREGITKRDAALQKQISFWREQRLSSLGKHKPLNIFMVEELERVQCEIRQALGTEKNDG